MKRYCAVTILFLLILNMLPSYAIAGEALSPEGTAAPVQSVTFDSPAEQMPSLTPEQRSKLYQVYTIKRGDSLISIGKQFGVNWRDIADLNGISGPKYTIITGHTLIISLLPKLSGTTGNYLILCETEAQKQSLAEFVAFKKWSGFTVTVKSVEADVKPVANTDASVAIQQYLKTMDKEMSLEYVLLIGTPYDAQSACPQHTGGIIPMRYLYSEPTNHKTNYSGGWYDYQNRDNDAYNTPTDIWYAFDFNWDYDADGYAGEADEIAKSVKHAKPEPLFLIGRIPFSDAQDIEAVLKATMHYELDKKSHSDALIGSIGEWNFYGNALAINLTKAKIVPTTIYDGGEEPLKFECTYILTGHIFSKEIAEKYDFVYTSDDFERYNFYLDSETGVEIGLYFMDDTSSMMVEAECNNNHIQPFMENGEISAAIATTREVAFNPDKPSRRMASLLFSNETLCISREFYASVLSMILDNNVPEAYIYCYLGDPSMALKP